MRFTIPLATITVALLAHAAHADSSSVEVYLQVKPDIRSAAPEIDAQIIGGPKLPLDKIQLVDGRGVSVPAGALREFKDGPDAIAIAFVIAGSEVMMGNDDMMPADDPALFHGYNAAIRKALQDVDLVHTMPRGSQGMLIAYTSRVNVRVPMGPIAKLGPDAVGIQLDYYQQIGTDMVDAIQVAIGDLSNVRTARKVLIVIGDGNDTNNEVAQTTLATLKKRAVSENIQTYALIYKSPVSSETSAITRMIPASQMVASTDGVSVALEALIHRLADRYYVTFPGEQLLWDGKMQDLTIRLGNDDTDPISLVLPDRRDHSGGGSPFGRWWFQLAIGLGAVGAIALLLRWRSARTSL
jgi:hypothetical protein